MKTTKTIEKTATDNRSDRRAARDRTDELLDRLGSDLTELDFARLVMAGADQAGLPLAAQQKLAALIEGHFGHEVLW